MTLTHVAPATPSAQPRHSGAVLAHGLHAVTSHVVEHGLDYCGIQAHDTDSYVTVRITADQAVDWRVSGFNVDEHQINPSGEVFGSDVHLLLGRLPDTGVRVGLRWLAPRVEVIDPTPCCELCNDTGLYSPVQGSGLSVSCPMCRGGERW